MGEPKRKISRIEIDKNACIGCGTCVVLAPEAFELGEEGYSVVKTSWQEVDDDTLMNAARSCPSGAIKLFDEKGNELKL